MYCPRCATDNSETTKFCRNCGANLSLIPHALQGALPTAPVVQFGAGEGRGGRRYEDRMSSGIRSVFMGAGFLLLALALIVTKQRWGIWMLIPGFTMLGKGAADIFNARSLQGIQPPINIPAVQTAPRTAELPPTPPQPIGAMPPASVTEQTTRYLEEKAERIKERG